MAFEGINGIRVPVGATSALLQHLVRLSTISQMAEVWALAVEESFVWATEVEQDCAVHLFSALRVTLRKLASKTLTDYLPLSEFREQLEELNGSMWREGLQCIYEHGVSLPDAATLCAVLRDTVLQALSELASEAQDEELLLSETTALIMRLFDWVLAEAHTIWWEHAQGLVPGLRNVDEMRALVESVREPVELQPVLQSIVERVRDSGLWPMCAIGILDPDDQQLEVPAQAGFDEDYPANVRFPAGGSATLETIMRGEPIAISDAFAEHDFPVLPDAARAAGYRAILMVPLAIEQLRAVVAFCTAEPHRFREEEIVLASAIAQQVMLAIENAQRYEREKHRTTELAALNRRIAEQNRSLQRSAEVHSALIQLVLGDAGMEKIVDNVRELLQNPVAIENEFHQLLVFSGDWEHFDRHRLDSIAEGGTARQLFKHPQTATAMEELRHHRRAMLIPSLPEIGMDRRRIVAPIMTGGSILGYVWVMEALRPFEELDTVTVEQTALVLALEMMKQHAAYETELRLKADFLDDLLGESALPEGELLQRAGFLGYNFEQPSLLLLVDLEPINRATLPLHESQALLRQRVLAIQDAVSDYSDENLVAAQSGNVVVIAALPESRPAEGASQELAAQIRHKLKQQEAEMAVTVALGGSFRQISDIRDCYHEATRALAGARSLDRTDQTIRLSDLGIYGILFREGENAYLRRFAEESLAPLLAYDRENGTELLVTLDTYLTNQGRLAPSARQLHVHVNTLRQRLERIQMLLQLPLDDPYNLLNLQIALRIHSVQARAS